MPLKILKTQDGRGKYYLTEMDYHPTEEEIYAGGWKPPLEFGENPRSLTIESELAFFVFFKKTA